MASTRTESRSSEVAWPAPLGRAALDEVPGVLGAIARERADDYEGAGYFEDAHGFEGAGAAARAVAPARGSLGIARPGRLRAALERPGIALLAEIKRASPSRGAIAELDPVEAALAYQAGGAAALSVLTEPRHFGGAREHLLAVTRASELPALRKDFVVHPAQLHEARSDGAAAVLLIVALVGDALRDYLTAAGALGLDALVEVHDEAELEVAISAGADLIGVNNRDLRSLEIDLSLAPRLIRRGRALLDGGVGSREVLWVAESGYRDGESLTPLAGLADAVLIGTSLAGSGDLERATREMVAAASRLTTEVRP